MLFRIAATMIGIIVLSIFLSLVIVDYLKGGDDYE